MLFKNILGMLESSLQKKYLVFQFKLKLVYFKQVKARIKGMYTKKYYGFSLDYLKPFTLFKSTYLS